jgi:ABC-type dipeptide/oligopeptide/nickel transport system permease component
MLHFLRRRLTVAILVALTVLTLSFLLTRLSGDLAISIAGPNATQEDIELIRRAYGLDRPLWVQYFDWLWRALQGCPDLGVLDVQRNPRLWGQLQQATSASSSLHSAGSSAAALLLPGAELVPSAAAASNACRTRDAPKPPSTPAAEAAAA